MMMKSRKKRKVYAFLGTYGKRNINITKKTIVKTVKGFNRNMIENMLIECNTYGITTRVRYMVKHQNSLLIRTPCTKFLFLLLTS